MRRLLTAVVLVFAAARTTSGQVHPPTLDRAGTVIAALPQTTIERRVDKFTANPGVDVAWNDLLRTDQRGRVRVTLVDQTIISLGSDSQLRVVKAQARTQQTTLELSYGRIRMQIVKVLQGGRFELRTPTAIAGVVGTDFGADASQPGVTKFVCIAGDVRISSTDPKVRGTVVCHAGSTITVPAGKPPAAPEPATPEQLERWRRITEP